MSLAEIPAHNPMTRAMFRQFRTCPPRRNNSRRRSSTTILLPETADNHGFRRDAAGKNAACSTYPLRSRSPPAPFASALAEHTASARKAGGKRLGIGSPGVFVSRCQPNRGRLTPPGVGQLGGHWVGTPKQGEAERTRKVSSGCDPRCPRRRHRRSPRSIRTPRLPFRRRQCPRA